jgi:hypothetical protein
LVSVTLLSVSLGIAGAGLGRLLERREAFPPPPPPVVASRAPVSPPAAVPLIGPCTEVDLGPYVTGRLDESMLAHSGNHLGALLSGLRQDGVAHRILHGVPFRLDGVVLVGPGEAFNGDGITLTVPPQVEGIPIGRKVKRLHFLHGTHWRTGDGTEIGAYIVHYADGSRLEIPIRYGEDVRDWWVSSDPESRVSGAQIAWSGSNEASARNRSRIRLYMKSWENPYPHQTIWSVDLVTGQQAAGPASPAPFLVGLTVEQGSGPAGGGSSPSKTVPTVAK